MARTAGKPRNTKNGRVLTAKNLPEKSYQVIHKLPFGVRQVVLHELISLAVPYAAKHGENWHILLRAKKRRIL